MFCEAICPSNSSSTCATTSFMLTGSSVVLLGRASSIMSSMTACTRSSSRGTTRSNFSRTSGSSWWRDMSCEKIRMEVSGLRMSWAMPAAMVPRAARRSARRRRSSSSRTRPSWTLMSLKAAESRPSSSFDATSIRCPSSPRPTAATACISGLIGRVIRWARRVAIRLPRATARRPKPAICQRVRPISWYMALSDTPSRTSPHGSGEPSTRTGRRIS